VVGPTRDALGQEASGALGVAAPEAGFEQRVVEDVALSAASPAAKACRPSSSGTTTAPANPVRSFGARSRTRARCLSAAAQSPPAANAMAMWAKWKDRPGRPARSPAIAVNGAHRAPIE